MTKPPTQHKLDQVKISYLISRLQYIYITSFPTSEFYLHYVLKGVERTTS